MGAPRDDGGDPRRTPSPPGVRPPIARRLAAVTALVLAGGAVVLAVVGASDDIARVVAVPVLLLATVAAGWTAATRVGVLRALAALACAAALLAVAVVILTADGHGLLVLGVVGLVAASTGLSRIAVPPYLHVGPDGRPSTIPVAAARHGVLLVNPRSGGGRAERVGLEEACRRRGVEPVVLRPGDDLQRLAQDAVDRGADVIGMAGGDGSQAVVATIARRADVALVCVPAGTRNHFALDLGLDRDDVVGALDAFGEALERRIDLATVGDTVFVNNVSLGVYASIVQADEYRGAKRQTATTMLPDLLGPEADPFDLHFVGPDGRDRAGARIIQVSNNPYVLTARAGFGTRARLDTGVLGIAAVTIDGAAGAAAFVAAGSAGRLDRFPGWNQWTAPTFRVDSGRPVEAGVDGEALVLDPPLEFRLHPGAVRVRVPLSAPGRASDARAHRPVGWTVGALVRTALGHPIDGRLLPR